MRMDTKYQLTGLDCANCAADMEKALREDGGLRSAQINFASGTIALNPAKLAEARSIIKSINPAVSIKSRGYDEPEEAQSRAIARRRLAAIFFSTFLLIFGSVFNRLLHETPFSMAEYFVLIPAYLAVGWSVLYSAVRNTLKGKFFEENFLMTVATIGAIAVHELPEAVGVMLFYSVGEYVQSLAVNKSRRSIRSLMDIRPEYANLKINGEITPVSPEKIQVGDIILVKPGEKVPLDGLVVEGTSFLDTSALTGESLPREANTGDKVLAGMISTSGLLTVEVAKEYEDSSIAKILELVESAAHRKAPTEQFITKFSRFYTPLVVLGAVALAVLPPLVIPQATFSQWIYRSLILLVISCPCALLISIPLGFFGGIGSASRRGILIKGSNYLEALTHVHTVVFDKTGTLTEGVFRVSSVIPEPGYKPAEVLELAAYAEVHSNHPIASSIVEAYDGDVSDSETDGYEEISGYGIKTVHNGVEILAGNDRLLHRENISHKNCTSDSTVVYVAVGGKLIGEIMISDAIKRDSSETIRELREIGVKRTVMLTGDEQSVADRVSAEIGIDEHYANLLPEDKVKKIDALAKSRGSSKGRIIAVGDGINDAPVIARADVGIAMGGLGSDAAIEAADVVIMNDEPHKIAVSIGIARYTRKIVMQNIALALGAKAFFIILGAIGIATMWEAVFADVGVTLVAVLNASRILRREFLS